MNRFFTALLMTVWIGTLGGCAAVVVGGAAAGGYYVGQDERTAAQIATDASITSTINTRYVQDGMVKARTINVDTYNGVVTLYGTVPSQAVADRAVNIARGVKNVRQVVSKLSIGG